MPSGGHGRRRWGGLGGRAGPGARCRRDAIAWQLAPTAAWLWAYQAVLVLVAVGLFADLLWGRWTQAAITGLVVDLGELEQAGTLRAKLARAVGDPSLEVAYRLPGA